MTFTRKTFLVFVCNLVHLLQDKLEIKEILRKRQLSLFFRPVFLFFVVEER